MNRICIHILMLRSDEDIELDVTIGIGGQKRLLQYRIESLRFGTASEKERIEQLRAFVRGYERRWELVQIGAPKGNCILSCFASFSQWTTHR